MKVFSLNRSRSLAQSIADSLSVPLSKSTLITFGDSEIKPVIQEDIRDEHCIIIGSTSNPVNDAYMELFLTVDALKRGSADKVTVVMPYFGYARQNQQHMQGEPVSAHVMVKFIESIGVDEIITIDIHEDQMMGFFSIPAHNISALPLLAEHMAHVAAGLVPAHEKATTRVAATNVIVISPDQGGVERTRTFRNALADTIRHPESRVTPGEGSISVTVDEQIGIVEKKRNLEGQHETKIVEVTGDVKDKIAIIPDDVIVSGGTIVNAAEAVLKAGAKKVHLCATHADFIEGTVEKLQNSPIKQVLVTDTIQIKDEWQFDKLEVISIVDILTNHIKSLHS